jgi:transposase InsO family protein
VNGRWVAPEIRDAIVQYIMMITTRTQIPLKRLLLWVGLKKNKYQHWRKRRGETNKHNGKIPRLTWILPWEREAIIAYCRDHPGEGYRRLSYRMLDENIVAVSPSSTYRVLKGAGLLTRWNTVKSGTKEGFDQPDHVHQHWHTDIKYVNVHGTFLFLISIIDGFSRYIVHHELRVTMQEYDVQLTLERALKLFPGSKPRIISDNGTQFVAKDFTEFIRLKGLEHVRTAIHHPQSNGKIERFHETISGECLRKLSFLDIEDARRRIADYIRSYNTQRLHSAVHYLTPHDVFTGRTEERLEDRKQKLAHARNQRRISRNAA